MDFMHALLLFLPPMFGLGFVLGSATTPRQRPPRGSYGPPRNGRINNPPPPRD